jgi:DNA sulfur modification protein DndD
MNLRVDSSGKVEKAPTPSPTADDGSQLVFLKEVRGDMEEVPDPESAVRSLIPESVREYFLFDGERLNSYFQETSGKRVQEAIFEVSQLELLERVADHLEKRRDDYYRRSAKLNPKAQQAQTDYQSAASAITRITQELKTAEAEHGTAEDREQQFRSELKAMSAENVSELEKEREQIKADIDRINESLKQEDAEKRELLLGSGPAILCAGVLQSYLNLIQKTEAAGEIPPEFRRPFLDRLLERGQCVCGSKIVPGSTHERAIKELIARISIVSELSGDLIRERVRAESLVKGVTTFQNQLQTVNGRIQRQEADLSTKEERSRRITAKIGGIKIDRVKQLEAEIERWGKAKDRAAEQIGTKRTELRLQNAAVKQFEDALKKELSKEGKSKKLLDLAEFCNQCLAAAEAVKSTITKTVRTEVDQKTNDYFMSLIWKKQTYRGVSIDEGYNVSVVHQSGESALGSLSAGERQVLALSFVAALNNVSGFDLPFVIDTPLGRISSEPKLNIARNLPRYLKGRQVILLMTEEEYTRPVRDALKSRFGKELKIDFRERKDGSEARIVPYAA